MNRPSVSFMMLALWKTVTFFRPRWLRVAEGPARDAGARDLGGHLEAGHHARRHLVLDAAVQALGVLAHDDQVHVVVAGGHAGQAAHRAHGRVEVQGLAQLDIDGLEALAHRGGAGAFEGQPVLAYRVQRGRGQHIAAALQRDDAGLVLDPLDGRARGGQHLLGGGGDFGADPVARDHNDLARLHDSIISGSRLRSSKAFAVEGPTASQVRAD
jgi:hypothetical protein